MKKFLILGFLGALCTSASFGAGRYRGDLNGDDRVDLADMVQLARSINSGNPNPAYDINNSGKVDDYDLEKLADIIVSGILTEDDGFNVGIGGWDEDDTDYGGIVKAPSRGTRSAEDMNFYINYPKLYGKNGKYSAELGIANASEAPCAMLFNIRLPWDLQFDNEAILELESSLLATHKVYGKISVKRENDNDPSSSQILRFIVFSPDLSPLGKTVGSLGRIIYSAEEVWGTPEFFDCQVLSEGYNDVVTIPAHQSDYIQWNSNSIDIGDVNGDGDVDIADVVVLVNHISGAGTTSFVEVASDINGDGDIDIADVVALVNRISNNE